MSKLSTQGRIRLLTTTSAAVAAVALAHPALAGNTEVTSSGPLTATELVEDAQDSINSAQENSGDISADVGPTAGGVSGVATLNDSIPVTGQEVSADALGPNVTNTIADYLGIENDLSGDGAATLAAQLNTGDISGSVNGNTIGADITDFQTGSITVTDNSIGATGTANTASTLLTGDIPSDYVSDTLGYSFLGVDVSFPLNNDVLDTEGGLTASTLQVNEAVSVAASAGDLSDNVIGIELDSATNYDIEGSLALSLNSITAAAKGNASDSLINITSGSNPVFTGTAVVANGQSNSPYSDGLAHSITGTNLGSQILTVTNTSLVNPYVVVGAVSVDNNTISSSASGNEALGDGVPGNYIVLDDNMSFAGIGGAPATTDIEYQTLGLAQEVEADLIINSSQGNTGAGNADRLAIGATTQGSQIGVNLRAVEGATVAVEDNESTASARGNTATSGFATGDSVNSFDGALAVANQQGNAYTNVTATNGPAEIGAELSPGQTLFPDNTVSVGGNGIAATAYGSQSEQSIALDAGTTTLPATDVVLGGGLGPDGHLFAEGGATVANLQGFYASSASATQGGGVIGASVFAETTSGSTIATSNNSEEAGARGNTASSSATLAGNTVGGAIGAVNTQIIADDFSIGALSFESSIGTLVQDVEDSTLDVAGNSQAASAYGNRVSQTVSVTGNDVDLAATGVSLHGGTDADGDDDNVSVDANVGLASLQSIDGDDVDNAITADVSGDGIGLTVDGTLSGSTGTVAGNAQEAVAVGNSGTNSLTLAGNDVGTGGGLASVQLADGVGIAATNIDAQVGAFVLGSVTDSTVETSGNLQRAIAYGGTVSNTLTVDASSVTVDDGLSGVASTVNYNPLDANGFVLDGAVGSQPEVLAAYGLLNIQTTHSEIIAEMVGESGILVDVGDVTTSTILNEGNAFVAAAYANDATNAAGLVGNGNVSTDILSSYVAVMNVTNAQTMVENGNYESTVTARASVPTGAGSGTIVDTYIDGTVDTSTVSTSANTIQALGYGNLAANSVSGAFNNIDTEDDAGFTTSGYAAVEGNEASVDASFSVNNVQAASGSILATLVDEDEDYSAEILTTVDGDVTDSSVHSDNNVLSAGATANRADNLIDLAGNELATSSALTNYQIDPTTIAAVIGLAGSDAVPPTPPTPGQVVNEDGQSTQGTLSQSGNDLIVSGSSITVTFAGASFTPEQVAYLNGLANVSGATLGGNSVNFGVGSIDTTDFDGFVFNSGGDGVNTGNESVTFGGFTVPPSGGSAGSPAVPNSGGVTIAISGAVDPSTVTVNANTIQGSVTGNSASNSISVDASHVPDGNDHIFTSATTDGLDTVAGGDHSLANVQIVTEGGSLTSEVYGTFAIDMDDPELVLDSTLEVDGNSQSARAVANTASNSVSLTAGNTEAGVALASNQASDAPVSATSDLEMFAPAASTNSTLSISDNTNLAVGVINNVTNSVTVDAGNASFVTFDGNVYLDVDTTPDDTVALGTHVLLNKQTATTEVSGTAVTTIYNDDNTALTTEGVNNGSVSFVGNSTTAEASANRAVNTMSVSASANLTANAGLVNNQSSTADATASATTSASLALYGDDPVSAISGSTATLGGNSTTALARGNAATNALNYSAGATYGDGLGTANITSGPGFPDTNLSAQAGVLNAQTNSGAINASSVDASYIVALNSVGSPTVTNATIGVIGNSVAAAAYGNTANNSVVVGVVNGNMPTVAVGNQQNNTGAVTASVTTVTYGITTGVGAATGSTLGVTSNSITATAVGNNAVNTIAAN